MIDFPITELLDVETCVTWLEQHLHPTGLVCPRCQGTDRRLFRKHSFFPTYRCRACQRTYTILTGSVFEKTRQRPATLVLLLRGIASIVPRTLLEPYRVVQTGSKGYLPLARH
jgi:transposase-like protein